MWDHVRDNCYCSLSKRGIQFFLSVALWQLQLTVMILGGVEPIEPEIKSKLKELKAPHIFTYLTAREEAMFVQPILCRKSHAWGNGRITLPEDIVCDTDQSGLWLLGQIKHFFFHLNSPNNLHILDWAHPESHFCTCVHLISTGTSTYILYQLEYLQVTEVRNLKP